MNKEYWKEFYKKKVIDRPSSFTEYVNSYITGSLIDLGCGNCRDLLHFIRQGISAKGVDIVDWNLSKYYIKSDIEEYVKNHRSPDTVYARFLWHAIERPLQLLILKWTKNIICIEARTTEDEYRSKIFGGHKRNYVDVGQLAKDLKDNDFEIIKLEEGIGFSKFRTENPHLVRVIAKKI